MTAVWLSALALLSGGCALAYEVLLLRALTTVLGDMFYVHAALLATFLVGIGLGAKLATHAFRYLFAFELATGAYAFLLPLVTQWLSGRSFMAAVTSSPTLTIVATVAAVIVPSLLIGFSIPLFSAYVKANVRGRLAFQGIYNAYNLGALLSVLIVEFVLLRHYGVAGSIVAIGAINLLNGTALLAIRAAPQSLPIDRPRRLGARLIVAVVLASVASALFQMFFLKLFYLMFAPHRENFAVALTVTLLGLFIGAWLASRVPLSFTTLVVLVPGLLGLIYTGYEPLVRLTQQMAPEPTSGTLAFLAQKLIGGSLFALGPMILFGGTLPALMRSESEVAHEAGTLLFASSLANAAGYLLYVLVGHPLLRASAVLVAIGLLALAAGLCAAGGQLSRGEWAVAAAGVLALMAMWVRWDDGRFYLTQWLALYQPDWRAETFKSGAESATLVHGSTSEWITYNGHLGIGVRQQGTVNLAEMVSGVIPGLGAPRLDRALVLGLGTGITAGAVSRIFKATDVVEINDAFLQMLPRLAYANLDIRENPAATLHFADGRAFLIGREGIYDAIVNSIPAPTYYSASKIYTLEFYERVKRALKPDGVFSTWLSVADMTEDGLAIMLSALRHSFPHCDLRVMRGAYYMATCSANRIRPGLFRDLPVQGRLVRELQRSAPWFDLDEFFVDHRVSEDLFDGFTPRVPRENSDDFPALEFQVTRPGRRGPVSDRDPFLLRWAEMGVDPTRGWDTLDDERAARRAGTFFVVSRAYFERFFAPRLARSPRRQAAFQAWLDDQARKERQRRNVPDGVAPTPDVPLPR